MSSPTGPQWGPPEQGPGNPPHQQGQAPHRGEPQPGQYGQGQYGQGQYGQPPQYGQPGQPQWGRPDQPPAQQWGQPTGQQPGQPQWGQPGQQWNQPTGQQPAQQWNQPGQQPQWAQPTQQFPQDGQWGQPGQAGGFNPPPQYPQGPGPGGPGEPPKKANKGVIITAVAVVVALLAGLGAYFLAFKDSNAGGEDTPQAAAAQLFADVDNGDLIGLTDTFDPVEAQFVGDLAADVIEQFKRLGLLTDDATVNNSTGTKISIQGITFDDAAAEKPLPDLTIVKLTGGTITVTPGENKEVETDLYQQLVDAVGTAAEGQGVPGMTMSSTEPTTIDIAKVIADQNNGEPIRISTVLRDGAWYPSLFYTAADYWAKEAGLGAVTADDAIPGAGKASPEEAVNGMIDALIAQNATDVIGLLPPDEMAAVHTYGKKIASAIGTGSPEDAQYTAEWTTSDVTGGTLVSLKSLEFTADGETGKVEIDQAAGSLTVTANGDTQTFDANSLSELAGTGDLAEIHPNMPDFVSRMIKAALGLGIVTTEVDGQWYVSPLRTTTGVFTTLLGGMEQQDIEMFIELAKK